jgi:hypothetical protein
VSRIAQRSCLHVSRAWLMSAFPTRLPLWRVHCKFALVSWLAACMTSRQARHRQKSAFPPETENRQCHHYPHSGQRRDQSTSVQTQRLAERSGTDREVIKNLRRNRKIDVFSFPNRQNGHEQQYKFTCPRCTLPVGYQSTPPPPKSGPYIYIYTGALSRIQGQVPTDAFEGENDRT